MAFLSLMHLILIELRLSALIELRLSALRAPFRLLVLASLPLYAVQLEVKARHIKVTGKRGTLERSFRHVQLEFTLESPEKLRVQCWFGTKKVGRWPTPRPILSCRWQ